VIVRLAKVRQAERSKVLEIDLSDAHPPDKKN
jgi:hypothetical protein